MVRRASSAINVAERLEPDRRYLIHSFVEAPERLNGEVCWQVTGVRQDAWADANPVEVEPLKAAGEQGKFLLPELHGAPASAAINRLRADESLAPPARLATPPRGLSQATVTQLAP